MDNIQDFGEDYGYDLDLIDMPQVFVEEPVELIETQQPPEGNLEDTLNITRSYAHEEEIILVGLVYEYLFLNPYLRKDVWEKIHKNFHQVLRYINYTKNEQYGSRALSALERHFKTLKIRNKHVEGCLFRELFEEWKDLKRIINSS
eukprot:snap_masked-scaffold_11-processed-gene-4.32-mRNA-1 protein AED:1.00 eAED:1.00 QI:0/-1/0/0/-1/1/1/0/145